MDRELKGLSSEEYAGISKLKGELYKQFGGGIELILFGSKARGDSALDSDIDVLVILDGDMDRELERKIRRVGYVIEREYDNVLFQLIIYSRRHWENVKDKFSFGINIQRDGVQL